MGKFTNLSKTLYSYFNGFGASAFLENTVPVGTPFPYITYTLSYQDEYEDNLVQARLWTKSSSMIQVADLTDKIETNIGNGITIKGADGGTIWLKKGSPFAQFITDDDITLKIVYINIVTNILI